MEKKWIATGVQVLAKEGQKLIELMLIKIIYN